jgi:hypothetical protein
LPAISIADIEHTKAGIRIIRASSGHRESILTPTSICALAGSGKALALDLA